MRFLEWMGFAAAAPLWLAAATGCGGIAVLSTDGDGGSAGSSSSSATSTVDPTLGCDPGWADCNGLAEDGCEVEFASDPASCGSCGHGCQGGACQTAVCQPVIIATGQSYAYRIAATPTSLYWTRSDGAVVRAKDGGEPEVIASGQNGPGDIAVDATHVYWANVGDGTIVRAPLEGTGMDIEVMVAGLSQPWSLALSPTMLAWSDNQTGDVGLLSLDEGAKPVVIATTPAAWSVALDDENVYWTTIFNGQVLRRALAGGEPQEILSEALSPADLALSGGRVFFGTASDVGVFAVPTGGGATVTLAATGGFGLAVDDQHVYYGEYDGRLSRVPVGGGDPEVLGIGPTTATDVALTATSVYWTSASDAGIILKVAK